MKPGTLVRDTSVGAALDYETHGGELEQGKVDLKLFSKINKRRCIEGFKHPLESWSIAEWTNAMCGEAGEAANVAKKLLRLRDGVPGNKFGEDEATLRDRCAKELADTIIYADLVMQALGKDTSEVVREVFNAKSDQLNSEVKVP